MKKLLLPILLLVLFFTQNTYAETPKEESYRHVSFYNESFHYVDVKIRYKNMSNKWTTTKFRLYRYEKSLKYKISNSYIYVIGIGCNSSGTPRMAWDGRDTTLEYYYKRDTYYSTKTYMGLLDGKEVVYRFTR